MMNKKSIKNGIQLNNPNVFIKWNMSLAEVGEIFRDCKTQQITEKAFLASTSLFDNNFDCSMVFHFDKNNKLCRIEIFRAENLLDEREMVNAYQNLNLVLERKLGKPSVIAKILYSFTKTNRDDLESRWSFGNVKIIHNI